MIDKNLKIIIIFSLLIKSIFVFFFHEKNLSHEWQILFENFIKFGEYSYYVFDDKPVPSSYMPPLYFFFLYLNKILNFEIFNFLYSVYFFQIIFSTISVYLFFKLSNFFLKKKYALIGTGIFSIFPMLIYTNGLVSSASLQLFLNLLFFKLFLDFLEKKDSIIFNKKTFFDISMISIISALNLLLRGEFLVIFLFSILYILLVSRKNILVFLTIFVSTFLIVSPYILRNYENTGKFHIVNVSGFALWKGNNALAPVEGIHRGFHPNSRQTWPKNSEFDNLYKKLDNIPKDKKFEINRDIIFGDEAIKNILTNKSYYIILYFKKLFSYFFFDFNSSLKNYYNPAHIIPIGIISLLCIPGIGSVIRKPFNLKIFYILSLMILISGIISIFFILPRYKITILSFQIIFAMIFIQFLLDKIRKN